MSLKKLEWWDRYKVADDSTDIRGWQLLDRAGHRMGEISDLIFEEESCSVRYAVADIGNRNVLVPVGMLALDEQRRQAVAPDLTMAEIAQLAGYSGASQLDDQAEWRHYRDYHPDAPEQAGASRVSYTSDRYTPRHERIARIEERLLQHIQEPQATFLGAEPAPGDRNEPGEPGSVWR